MRSTCGPNSYTSGHADKGDLAHTLSHTDIHTHPVIVQRCICVEGVMYCTRCGRPRHVPESNLRNPVIESYTPVSPVSSRQPTAHTACYSNRAYQTQPSILRDGEIEQALTPSKHESVDIFKKRPHFTRQCDVGAQTSLSNAQRIRAGGTHYREGCTHHVEADGVLLLRRYVHPSV